MFQISFTFPALNGHRCYLDKYIQVVYCSVFCFPDSFNGDWSLRCQFPGRLSALEFVSFSLLIIFTLMGIEVPFASPVEFIPL